jgi:hypothetical protein
MLAVRRSTLHFFVFGEIKLIGESAGKCGRNQGFGHSDFEATKKSGEGNTGKPGIPVV